ncbi:transmembrane emp24 domain-containing protein 7-like isoform X1 [Mizuhopecten yessoensis]|uniref:transmembrane emp24 domain-containing protein 7-like isoform X1 n=1 Tax=Mizuhopecten yessoensis TaxID=6573 RepID=UPI000B4571CB|nr:transmembrane emp24 domain-containing protein 7-like isoform X1 [Mizuhopecten yessoensis]
MDTKFGVVTLILGLISYVLGGELTFELPDNAKQCFYEHIDKGVESTLEFQVITGGQYDVDMELTAPNKQVLYKDVKKQYDSFTWTPDQKGIYQFCFSNEFSTFSHKVVYFDLQIGDEKPLFDADSGSKHHTAMTLMESASEDIHDALNDVVEVQTHFRLREAQGRVYAENLNERVFYWSLGEFFIIMSIGISQVFILKGFFTDKKTTSGIITS